MRSLVAVAHEVSPAAAGLLIASVWQGLLLTGGVALALTVIRSVSPAVRTRIWAAVLLLVLGLPILALGMPHGAAPAHTGVHVAEGWSLAIVAVWVGLASLRGALLVADGLRLRRLARRAVPVEVEEPVASLLQRPRRALLCVSPEVNRPSVTGFFWPRVLLPEGLLETLSAAELEHVVRHEVEHLRRGDDWLNLLQQISLVLLPLNPALLWLDRQLCRERELACDDGVLQATKARSAYAACLVKLAEDSLMRKGLTLALSALGTRAQESELVCRVRRILAGPAWVGKRRGVQVALGTLTLALLGGFVLLTRSPQVVTFDASAAVAPGAEPVRAERVPVSTPVSALAGSGGLRPVLTRAVVDHPGLMAARPVTQVALRHKAPRLRSLQLRVAMPGARRWPVTPARNVAQSSTQRSTNVPAEDVALPAGHLVVTEFEVSQPGSDATWAAVPWRGGWLIVQL